MNALLEERPATGKNVREGPSSRRFAPSEGRSGEERGTAMRGVLIPKVRTCIRGPKYELEGECLPPK